MSNFTSTPKTRIYPKITTDLPYPTRPISFICVKYSNEFRYNIATSECIHDDLNEFIVVDNRSDIFFKTFGQAIHSGIALAKNDLLVIVHEDVILLPGWQAMFEKSLLDLEQHDPNWMAVGLIGWDENEKFIGHSSDPYGLHNTFRDESFIRAAKIDEQVLVLRKSKGLFPDVNLPSIHNIGQDIVWSAAQLGDLTYVINAPSVHKYADATGKLILGIEDSKKIQSRNNPTYIHNKECSDEYLQNKWREKIEGKEEVFDEKELTDQQMNQLNSPIIFIGFDDAVTKVISDMASNIGLFIGNQNNSAGDCLEMVGAIFRAVFRKYRCPSQWQKSLIIPDLRKSSIKMLKKASWPTHWGFKLTESLLILPELQAAFPKAKYVFFYRDPLTTVLSETHMTTRLDNEIGRTVIPLAYDFAKLPRETTFSDNSTIQMAHGIAYQIGLVMEFKSSLSENHWHNISFENLITRSRDILNKFAEFCGREILSDSIFQTNDHKNIFDSNDGFSQKTTSIVQEILDTSRMAMKYSK